MQTLRNSQGARRSALAACLILLTLAGGAGARPLHGGRGPKTEGAKAVALSGQIGGTWTQPPQAANAGAAYLLSGNGDVAPLGPVQVTGSLLTHGAGKDGRTAGTVTLTGTQGTLTLTLSGAAGQTGPIGLTYTVTGSTGAPAGQGGTGTVQLTMTPQRRPAAIPGRMTPHYIMAAMFTLTFGASPVAPTGPAHG